MTEPAALRRLELAMGAVALTAVLAALAVGADVARFHLAEALRAGPLSSPGHLGVCAVVLAEALALALGLRSLRRRVGVHRRVLRRLRGADVRRLHGVDVHVLGDDVPRAFCAGLLRPRVAISTGALAALSPDERRAVLLHEAHHAARRDPLRRAAMGALADALLVVPGMRTLGQGQSALCELTADARAVRAGGAVRDLASALVTLSEHRAAAPGGIAPERVDHLMGRLPRRPTRHSTLVALGVAVVVLAASLGALVLPGHHDVCHVLFRGPATGGAAIVFLLAWPAWVGRQVLDAIRS